MIHVGSRLHVSSYSDPILSAGDIHIYIRPSTVFGDGSHATTQMCLEMLELELQRGDRVVDIGTGTGILAIAAAKLGARDV
ncbi:MAG: 50S ribosomal protein L11 methyltransferase [candidate division NC10 bacterium]